MSADARPSKWDPVIERILEHERQGSIGAVVASGVLGVVVLYVYSHRLWSAGWEGPVNGLGGVIIWVSVFLVLRFLARGAPVEPSGMMLSLGAWMIVAGLFLFRDWLVIGFLGILGIVMVLAFIPAFVWAEGEMRTSLQIFLAVSIVGPVIVIGATGGFQNLRGFLLAVLMFMMIAFGGWWKLGRPLSRRLIVRLSESTDYVLLRGIPDSPESPSPLSRETHLMAAIPFLGGVYVAAFAQALLPVESEIVIGIIGVIALALVAFVSWTMLPGRWWIDRYNIWVIDAETQAPRDVPVLSMLNRYLGVAAFFAVAVAFWGGGRILEPGALLEVAVAVVTLVFVLYPPIFLATALYVAVGLDWDLRWIDGRIGAERVPGHEGQTEGGDSSS